MRWIILLFLVIFSVACSNEPHEMQLSNASLKCEIEGAELQSGLKSTYYRRGNAPVYISGVVLTAENTEYSVDDIVSEYTFNPDGQSVFDKDIVIEGLTVGNNIITAEGVCNSTAENKYYINVSRADGDLNERANSYAVQLRGTQPIFADYKSENPLNVKISNSNNNTASISMVTENHRVVVVLENSYDSEYYLYMEILEDGNATPLCSSSDVGNLPVGMQDAIVVNNENAKGSKTYTVKVTYYTKDSNMEVGIITKTIVANAYDNITKLYHFNKGELEVGDAEAFMTWTPMEKDNSGETIN